jgi:hypothetical protein
MNVNVRTLVCVLGAMAIATTIVTGTILYRTATDARDAAIARKYDAEVARKEAAHRGSATEVKKPQDCTLAAKVAAKEFVRDSLKNPRSAEFGGLFDDNPRAVCDGAKCTVTGWVEATNAFGATIRTRWWMVVAGNDQCDGWSATTGPKYVTD